MKPTTNELLECLHRMEYAYRPAGAIMSIEEDERIGAIRNLILALGKCKRLGKEALGKANYMEEMARIGFYICDFGEDV